MFTHVLVRKRTKTHTLQQLNRLITGFYFVNQLVECSKAVAGALRTQGDTVGLGRIHYLHYQWVTLAPRIPFKAALST